MEKFREVAEILGKFVKPCPRRHNKKLGENARVAIKRRRIEMEDEKRENR